MNNTNCPVCNYEHPEGGPVEIESGGATQAMSCPQCSATWNDCYVYAGASFTEEDPNGDRFDSDPEGPDREPSQGPDYWRNENGEYRLG